MIPNSHFREYAVAETFEKSKLIRRKLKMRNNINIIHLILNFQHIQILVICFDSSIFNGHVWWCKYNDLVWQHCYSDVGCSLISYISSVNKKLQQKNYTQICGIIAISKGDIATECMFFVLMVVDTFFNGLAECWSMVNNCINFVRLSNYMSCHSSTPNED